MPGVGQWLVQAVCAGEEACYLRGRNPAHWHQVGATVPASLPPHDALLARCFLCDAAASPTDLVIEVGIDDVDGAFIDARCSDARLCDARPPSSSP